jgi:hypothetical protein
MKYLFTLIFLLVLTSCSTHPHSEGRSDYIRKIDAASAGDKQFSGLYDNFEFRATLLTPSVAQLIHRRKSQIYEWDQFQQQEHLDKQQAELYPKTRVWMSFFTPSNKDDNLDKKDSIWKTYLVVDGKRYEGQVTRSKQSLSEAQALFDYHNRWATIYLLDFPLPSSQVESAVVQLIITGPLGRREVFFNTQAL